MLEWRKATPSSPTMNLMSKFYVILISIQLHEWLKIKYCGWFCVQTYVCSFIDLLKQGRNLTGTSVYIKRLTKKNADIAKKARSI